MLRRTATLTRPILARPLGRAMSTEARPMTRFIQYPFDKTKMAEVRAWVNGNGIAAKVRANPGVKDIEISFCPGEGWLATRFIYDDLADLQAYLGSELYEEMQTVMKAAPHYDARAHKESPRRVLTPSSSTGAGSAASLTSGGLQTLNPEWWPYPGSARVRSRNT